MKNTTRHLLVKEVPKLFKPLVWACVTSHYFKDFIMKTLKLFNAVVGKSGGKLFVSEDGYFIEADASWAKDNIVKFYRDQALNGNDLNKTFHKSWAKVRNSSRYELYLEQIRHYLSTYGSNFQDEVYIPNEVLEVPDLELKFKVVRAYTVAQMTDRCLKMLQSGIALKEETIDDLLSVLVDELNYQFTGNEGVRNKEAVIKIADMYGVLPKDTMEFFRYIIYRATGQSLLIKSPEVISAVKSSTFNPSAQFSSFGLDKLATIFNRFKPLFLAFKNQCPSTINKISRLSKVLHKPMVQNPLSLVTQCKLADKDKKWLDNATLFSIFKALSACHTRMSGSSMFMYRIRNGKSWLKAGTVNKNICRHNYLYLMAYLSRRVDFQGVRVFIPECVEYALPTSEKMFVGNIPTGTRFIGNSLAAGVYWENSWGASDIDLSSINITGGKIGWNADYSDRSITYSGDMTDAYNGAVEYLHAKKLSKEYLVQTNIYTGDANCGYKIVVGEGAKIDKNYMMNPNKVLVDVKCQSVQKQTIIGMFMPTDNYQDCFVLLNFGAGHARVSGSRQSEGLAALYSQWRNPLLLNDVLYELGVEFVEHPEDAEFDLSLENLNSDSFTKIFEERSTKKSLNGV